MTACAENENFFTNVPDTTTHRSNRAMRTRDATPVTPGVRSHMRRVTRARLWGFGALLLISAAYGAFGMTCLGQISIYRNVFETRAVRISTTLGAFHFGYQRHAALLSGVPVVGDFSAKDTWRWGAGSATASAFIPSFESNPAGFECSVPAFAIWAPLGIAAVLARKRQRRLANSALCENCGYEVRTSVRCTECGAAPALE